MDGDETSGPIDFDFFSGESEKSTTVHEIEQRNGIKRLPEVRSLTTHTKTVRENDNVRPRSHDGSAGQSSDNSTDSESSSESDGGRSPRSVSSRSTNISVKVPTARDDSGGSESSDHGGKIVNISDDDRENNNNTGRAHADSSEHKTAMQTSQRKVNRPRTAKTRTRSSRSHKKSWSSEDPSESESNSDKEDSEPSKSFSSSHSDTKSSATGSESDSDTSVTDVSPLHSPERSPQNEDLKSKKRSKDRKADGVRFVDVTPGYSIHGKSRQPMQDSEARELSVLLRAVLEMDDYPDRSDLASLEKKMNRPSSGKSKRGGSRPRSAHMPHQRMNMSFSNDEVQKIDRENQRLLKKILSTNRTQTSANGSSSYRSTSKHMSHSAVRRQREQRKIEMENMKILQRIESAKASPMIRKENLVQHYQQQVQYSNQVGKSPHRPSSARRTGSTYVNKMAKASSMSSLNSDFSKFSVATGSTRSRPSSGKRSIMSDSRPPERARPAWDDHWHVT